MQTHRALQTSQIGFDVPAQFVERQDAPGLQVQGGEEIQDLPWARGVPAGYHPALHQRSGGQVRVRFATSLLAAANDPRIKAVVDDSGFSDAPGVIGSSFEHFIGLPAFPFASITTAIVTWRKGVDVKRIRPVDVVARIAPRPLLIIQCIGDRVVPPVNSERNFKAAGDPKSIWRIPTGGHIDGYALARQEYERRVIEFFDKSLAAQGP